WVVCWCGSRRGLVLAHCDEVLLDHPGGEQPGPAELPLPLGRHVRVEVPLAGGGVLDLPGPGHAESLLEALARLVLLRHDRLAPAHGGPAKGYKGAASPRLGPRPRVGGRLTTTIGARRGRRSGRPNR